MTEVSNKSVPDHIRFGVVPSLKLFAESLIHIYQTNRLRNKNFLDLKILELLYLLNGLAAEQQFANFLFRLTLPKKRNIKTCSSCPPIVNLVNTVYFCPCTKALSHDPIPPASPMVIP